MTKKQSDKPGKRMVRSSAAESLTFVAATAVVKRYLITASNGKRRKVKQGNIMSGRALQGEPVIRKFRITAAPANKRPKIPVILWAASAASQNPGRCSDFAQHVDDYQPGVRAKSVPGRSEFEKYRFVQDRLFKSDFDRLLKQLDDSQGGES